MVLLFVLAVVLLLVFFAVDLLFLGEASISGFSTCSWASVRPILARLVPHSKQVPLVIGDPVFVYSAFGLMSVRFVLHLTQYACKFSVIRHLYLKPNLKVLFITILF
ncbi:hypothetical protein MASR2M15_23290 [Anaerolineales bacterium]